MNKIILTLLVILSIGAAVKGNDDDDQFTVDDAINMLESFVSNCDPKPQKEHLREMLLHKKDAQRTTKCLRYCLLNRLDLLLEGNRALDTGKTVEMMSIIFSDRDEELKKIMDKCGDLNKLVQDNCEWAHGMAMCGLKEMQDAGFKIPQLKESRK